MPSEPIPLTPSLLRYLGVEPQGQPARLLPSILEEASSLLEERTWRTRLELAEFQRLFSPWAGRSRALAKLLDGCAEVHLLAATLGPGLEQRARRSLGERQVFKGYVLDKLGSYLVEQAVRRLDREIKQEAQGRGAMATHRYSPGYGDFPLEAQAGFLALLARELPGLSLSAGGIIQPEKTVTALMGEFPPGPR